MNTFIHATSTWATSMFWLKSRDHDTLTLSSRRAMRAFQDSDIWLADPKVSSRVLGLASSRTRVVQLDGVDDSEEKSRALALDQMRRYLRAGYSVARLQADTHNKPLASRHKNLRLPLTPSQTARGVTLVAPTSASENDVDWVRLSHTGMTLVCYMGATSLERLYGDLMAIGCRPGLRVTAVYYDTGSSCRHHEQSLSRLRTDVVENAGARPAVIILNGMMPL